MDATELCYIFAHFLHDLALRDGHVADLCERYLRRLESNYPDVIKSVLVARESARADEQAVLAAKLAGSMAERRKQIEEQQAALATELRAIERVQS